MKFIYYISICLLLTACNNTIESKANQAANDYCGCINDNKNNFDEKQALQSYCLRVIYNKYRLYQLYLDDMSVLNFEYSSQAQEDSVKTFRVYFDKQIEGCVLEK
jgi:hypothetical protein